MTSLVPGTLPAGIVQPRCIAFGAGLFVVLYNGVSATSPDGKTWTQRNLPTSQAWSRLTFANGRFVAVAAGPSQTAITSTDGINWTASTMPFSTNWQDVVFGGGLFLAVSSSNGRVATSPDGITWTGRTIVVRPWGNVVYGAGKFVITANGTSNSDEITHSTDGVTFVFSGISGIYLPAPGKWTGSIFVNSKFLLLSSTGVTLVSLDGNSWTIGAMPYPGTWQDVTFGNGIYVASGIGFMDYPNDLAAISTDGLSWTALPADNGQAYRDIAFGVNIFVTVADAGLIGVAVYDPNAARTFWRSLIGSTELP